MRGHCVLANTLEDIRMALDFNHLLNCLNETWIQAKAIFLGRWEKYLIRVTKVFFHLHVKQCGPIFTKFWILPTNNSLIMTITIQLSSITVKQRGKSIRASVSIIVILHQTTQLNYRGWHKNWCKTYLYRLKIEVILPY